MPKLDTIRQDLRHALRAIRRSPGYVLGASLTLGIGVGATAAVMGAIDAVFVRGLPYRDIDRLAMIVEQSDSGGFRTPSYPTFLDWRRERAVWNGAIENIAFIRGSGVWMQGPEGAERLLAGNVSPGFFALLGTQPMLGRTFLPDEERPGGPAVAVLAHETWRRNFGGDPDVVGRIVSLEDAPTTIIGVMPPGFAYPQWTASRWGATALWMPIALIERTDVALAQRGDHADSRTIARFRTAGDSARAAAALGLLQSRLADVHPAETTGWEQTASFGLRGTLVGSITPLLTRLAGAVALVLLLACVNVANLSFVRGTSRAPELAVRTALGGGRWDLVRPLLAEGVVIGAIGGAIGIVIATGMVAVMRALATEVFPPARGIAVDMRLIAFTIAIAMLAAVVAALIPALRAAYAATPGTVRSSSHSAIGGRHDARLRGVLVIAQLAIALVLLVGTGLLARSVRNIVTLPLGYDPRGLVSGNISVPAGYSSPAEAAALYQRLVERVAQVPGVDAVAISNPGTVPTQVRAELGGAEVAPLYRTVSEGYLATMGMSVARGRWFTEDDMRARERFVVNESLARRLFGDADPVGQRLTVRRASRQRSDFGQPVTGTVVGVVRDVRRLRFGIDPAAEIYVPYTLETWPWVSLLFRSDAASRTIPLAREAVRQVDAAIPEAVAAASFGGFALVDEFAAQLVAQRRLALTGIGAFSLVALVLAAIGLYAVISYGVAMRRREIGVRMALGATPSGILRLVLGEGLQLGVAGTVVGVAGAFFLMRLVQSLLYGTAPTDIASYALAAGTLLVTVLVACYLPARRAARVDPTQAVRASQ